MKFCLQYKAALTAFVTALDVIVAPLIALISASPALPPLITVSSEADLPSYWVLYGSSFALRPRPGVSLISRKPMEVMLPSSLIPTEIDTLPP